MQVREEAVGHLHPGNGGRAIETNTFRMFLRSGPVSLHGFDVCMFAGNPLLEKEEREGPEPLPRSAFLSTHSVWCLAGGPFVCEFVSLFVKNN